MSSSFDVEHVTAALEARYRVLHSIHANRGYRQTAAREQQWRRVAQACIQNNVSAADYVSWAYQFYCATRPLVFVEMVASMKTFSIYLAQKGDSDRRFNILIRLQFVRLQDELKRGRTLDEILLDSGLDLGVVFRYAVASRMGRPDLAARFQMDAEREMLCEPRYRRALAGFLPAVAGEGDECTDKRIPGNQQS